MSVRESTINTSQYRQRSLKSQEFENIQRRIKNAKEENTHEN
nr:MAG TPA: hypothetical protein [Caudoviricetes sp.]